MVMLLAQVAAAESAAADVIAGVAASAWYTCFLWGALGGLMVDGLEIVKVLKQHPEQFGLFMRPGYLIAAVLRLSIGGVLAVALGASGEIQPPLGALVVGMTAPMIVERYLANPPTPGGGTRGN